MGDPRPYVEPAKNAKNEWEKPSLVADVPDAFESPEEFRR
jgi:hypothetical protein